jgi:hypothetical protein
MDLSGDELKHIIHTVAYGSTDELFEVVYGNDVLTKEQLRIPLGLLSELHDPTSESAISIAEARYQDPFWMLILQVPWLNHKFAGPYTPLLLAYHGGSQKVAGKVLPWNEISSMFTKDQKDAAVCLTKWWAIWLKKYQQTK